MGYKMTDKERAEFLGLFEHNNKVTVWESLEPVIPYKRERIEIPEVEIWTDKNGINHEREI